MQATRFPHFISVSALFLALSLTGACSTLEGAYDDMLGNNNTAPKVAVKSPNAAPVQLVNTQDLSTPPMANNFAPNQPVELGSMNDQAATTMGQPALVTQIAPEQPIVPMQPAPAETAPVMMEQATAPVAPTPAIVPSASLRNALLTVRFNQPHVYYDDALASAVSQAENAKPGVVYDVLSTVPDLSVLPAEQQQKLSGRAKDNLRNVVVKMQQMGVPADRIRIAEQVLKIRSQEIQLFVR